MAKQSGKSPLGDKFARSLASHAKDETTYARDFTNLPPGIIGGVAKLVDARLGTYAKGNNQGERFLFLSGTVVEPKEVSVVRHVWQDNKVVALPVEQVRVEGLFTRQTLPLCDTKTRAGDEISQDENVAAALNVLRTLGGEECTSEVADEESLQSLLDTLKESDIYFKFNTSASKVTADNPDERTWENWRGACEYVQDEEDNPVVDETGEEEEEDSGKVLSDEELLALGKKADVAVKRKKPDGEAEGVLGKSAEDAGVDPNELETWTEVAEATIAARGTEEFDPSGEGEKEEEEEGEEEVPSDPAKGEVWLYKPPHAKKATEVEVTAVFPAKRMANVKVLDDGRIFKAVPFDKLQSSE
jgi:hypothetical protein